MPAFELRKGREKNQSIESGDVCMTADVTSVVCCLCFGHRKLNLIQLMENPVLAVRLGKGLRRKRKHINGEDWFNSMNYSSDMSFAVSTNPLGKKWLVDST